MPPTSTAFVAMCDRSALTSVRTVHTGCHVSWWKEVADRQMSAPTWQRCS